MKVFFSQNKITEIFTSCGELMFVAFISMQLFLFSFVEKKLVVISSRLIAASNYCFRKTIIVYRLCSDNFLAYNSS